MDTNRFVETMKMLEMAYNRWFTVTDDMVMVWMRFFSDLPDMHPHSTDKPEDIFEKAAIRWIKENNKSPTIADLLAVCSDIEKEIIDGSPYRDYQ